MFPLTRNKQSLNKTGEKLIAKGMNALSFFSRKVFNSFCLKCLQFVTTFLLPLLKAPNKKQARFGWPCKCIFLCIFGEKDGLGDPAFVFVFVFCRKRWAWVTL